MSEQTTYTAVEMAKRLLVDSIWKSARLEGLGTTFPKTEAILENIPTTTTSEEVLFVINMKRAWEFLFENVDEPNNLMLIRQFNKLAGEGLFRFSGDLHTIPVLIGGTDWTPEIPHQGVILEKIDEINSLQNPETKAIEFFCFVARTQMFIDGNKRVAQLMANKVLIENNIGIFQIPIDKIEYFKELLVKYYETNDSVKIKGFMLENCIKKLPEICLKNNHKKIK